MRVLALCLCLLLSACGKEEVQEAHLLTFGTLVDITLWGVDESRAQAVFAALDSSTPQRVMST
ncbi:MAG: hypothetical protein D6819_00050, partial [Gammaproteobacteria bacterium]